jgi:hypothetical protein
MSSSLNDIQKNRFYVERVNDQGQGGDPCCGPSTPGDLLRKRKVLPLILRSFYFRTGRIKSTAPAR